MVRWAGAGNGAVMATDHGSPGETQGPEPGPAYNRHRASARPSQSLGRVIVKGFRFRAQVGKEDGRRGGVTQCGYS
jgi:hypothetical protein